MTMTRAIAVQAHPLAQKLSRQAAQGISALSREVGVSWGEAAFLVLRDAGLSQRRAYLAVHPTVTDESAKQLGSKAERKLADVPRPIDVNLMQAGLADIVAIQAMLDSEVSTRDRLTAADQTNRKLQRYADGAVQINVLAALHVPDDEQPATLLPLELPQDVVVPSPEDV